MNIFIALLLCILAGLGSVLGSLLVFIPFFRKTSNIGYIIGFSSIIMIYISIFDLLPVSISYLYNVYNNKSFLIVSLGFIIGVLIINILNHFIKEKSSIKKVGIISLIGLIIHNVPEGIVTFFTSLTNIDLGIKLTISILLHNIPEGVLITIPLYLSTNKVGEGLKYSFISSLSEVLGALLTMSLLKYFINDISLHMILSIVSGIMISIGINNLYKIKTNNKKIIIGIISGLLYIFISLFFL